MISSALPNVSTAAVYRRPRSVPAFILLVTSSLTVLVTAILGPSLPAMQRHFADVPGVDYMIPLTMTAPMLTMAALSIFAGAMADRIGRKRMRWGPPRCTPSSARRRCGSIRWRRSLPAASRWA